LVSGTGADEYSSSSSQLVKAVNESAKIKIVLNKFTKIVKHLFV
jgi:hypothetical protein